MDLVFSVEEGGKSFVEILEPKAFFPSDMPTYLSMYLAVGWGVALKCYSEGAVSFDLLQFRWHKRDNPKGEKWPLNSTVVPVRYLVGIPGKSFSRTTNGMSRILMALPIYFAIEIIFAEVNAISVSALAFLDTGFCISCLPLRLN